MPIMKDKRLVQRLMLFVFLAALALQPRLVMQLRRLLDTADEGHLRTYSFLVTEDRDSAWAKSLQRKRRAAEAAVACSDEAPSQALQWSCRSVTLQGGWASVHRAHSTPP